MWIRYILLGWKGLLQRVWQTPSYQRLAIALVLSLLLHLFLMGKFDFTLANDNVQPRMIEAKLLLTKPLLTPVAVEPVTSKTSTAIVEPVPASPIPTEPVIVNPEPEVLPESTPMIAESELPKELPAPTDAIESTQVNKPTAPELTAEDQSADLGIVINPNAYKFVESTFDVRTDITAAVDSSPEGVATIVYALQANGEQYQLKSLMQAKGLAALVIPDLLQTSDGFLSNTGLQPKHYLYQFGDKKNKTYSADFDWNQNKLTLHTAKGDQTVELLEGTQDLLSFMYQFMFVPPLQSMQLNITNGKKLGIYDYVFEGEEIITTKMGKLNTIHLSRATTSGDEKTELWLALDYQYVPVKIRKTEKEDKVYELLVRSLKTES